MTSCPATWALRTATTHLLQESSVARTGFPVRTASRRAWAGDLTTCSWTCICVCNTEKAPSADGVSPWTSGKLLRAWVRANTALTRDIHTTGRRRACWIRLKATMGHPGFPVESGFAFPTTTPNAFPYDEGAHENQLLSNFPEPAAMHPHPQLHSTLRKHGLPVNTFAALSAAAIPASTAKPPTGGLLLLQNHIWNVTEDHKIIQNSMMTYGASPKGVSHSNQTGIISGAEFTQHSGT